MDIEIELLTRRKTDFDLINETADHLKRRVPTPKDGEDRDMSDRDKEKLRQWTKRMWVYLADTPGIDIKAVDKWRDGMLVALEKA